MWDIDEPNNRPLVEVFAHKGGVACTRGICDRKQQWVLTCGVADSRVIAWDIERGEQLCYYDTKLSSIRDLTMSIDFVIVSGASSTLVWHRSDPSRLFASFVDDESVQHYANTLCSNHSTLIIAKSTSACVYSLIC